MLPTELTGNIEDFGEKRKGCEGRDEKPFATLKEKVARGEREREERERRERPRRERERGPS